jgi:N-acylneuraminate cytidylyltransferase
LRILIIPVRGGSKGIPNKNLQTVNGITLVERAIRTSLRAKIDEIIVSTDSEEIKKVVKKYQKIKIHNRSNETSGDTASTESVILEVINDLGEDWPENSSIGFYQVTSPFVETNTIDECFSLADQGYSSFSARNFHAFVWRNSKGWKSINHPIDKRFRRQDLEQEVIETGALYCFPQSDFLVKKYRYCSEPKAVIVQNEITSLEIDSFDELNLAKLISTQYEVSNFNEFKDIKLPKIIFTDFDGCLTDDKVKVNMLGKETVKANRKDGLAVKRLRKLGIEVVISTSETNKVVDVRAKKMKVELLKGLENKVEAISKYLNEKSLNWSDVWYLGNDINDLGAIEKAELSLCPLDAAIEVFEKAKVVLSRRGGEGLLSEIASRLERNKIEH